MQYLRDDRDTEFSDHVLSKLPLSTVSLFMNPDYESYVNAAFGYIRDVPGGYAISPPAYDCPKCRYQIITFDYVHSTVISSPVYPKMWDWMVRLGRALKLKWKGGLTIEELGTVEDPERVRQVLAEMRDILDSMCAYLGFEVCEGRVMVINPAYYEVSMGYAYRANYDWDHFVRMVS